MAAGPETHPADTQAGHQHIEKVYFPGADAALGECCKSATIAPEFPQFRRQAPDQHAFRSVKCTTMACRSVSGLLDSCQCGLQLRTLRAEFGEPLALGGHHIGARIRDECGIAELAFDLGRVARDLADGFL